MPIPLIPIVIAAVASAVVVGAIIYFFTSNDANQKRVEYMTRVNEVLELLQQKVGLLKEIINKKEEKIQKLEKMRVEDQKTIQKLIAEANNYKSELEKVERERDEMVKEISSWKAIHEKVLAGLSLPLTFNAVNLIKSSTIFKESKYKPENVFNYLQNKKDQLANDILHLN